MNMKTILVLAANPTTVQLQLDEEVRNIRAALERSKGRNGFRLETRSAIGLIEKSDRIAHQFRNPLSLNKPSSQR